MSRFHAYRHGFSNARLNRSKSGVLEVALHTDGGTLVFNLSTCFTRSGLTPIIAW